MKKSELKRIVNEVLSEARGEVTIDSLEKQLRKVDDLQKEYGDALADAGTMLGDLDKALGHKLLGTFGTVHQHIEKIDTILNHIRKEIAQAGHKRGLR